MYALRRSRFAALGTTLLAIGLSALGGCGSGSEEPAVGDVTPAPSELRYTSPVTAQVGVALPALTPTVAGNVTSYSVLPALPTGIAIDPVTGVISGTPSVAVPSSTYTVTAASSRGSTQFALSLKVDSSPQSAYSMSRLVSDGSTTAAAIDLRLRSPRGLAASAEGPFRVTSHSGRSATAYDGTGRVQPSSIDLPPGVRGLGNVTGIVASHSATEFAVTNAGISAPARFLFATEAGTIAAWSPDVSIANAFIAYDDAAGGAVYKGLAIARTGAAQFLYAADFRNNRIDVFNATFSKVTTAGGFTDPGLPEGYSPFNIQALQWSGRTALLVAYAKPDIAGGNAVAGNGLGLVNVFDLDGTLRRRLISTGGRLNAPWGLAVAPATFGTLGNALLVGNSGDGRINGFDPDTGAFIHALSDASGAPIVNDGLWGMAFGNGASNQPVGTLFLAAAINAGTGGLYARVDPGATAPDVVAPDVVLTTPTTGTTASGAIPLNAVATDNIAVTRVLFSARIGTLSLEIASDSSAPYSASWNTTATANGPATLTATAFDSSGNSTTSPGVTVDINNLPGAPPTLATLQATIFGAQCTGCHNGAGPNLPNSLNLTSVTATAASLINVNSLQSPLQKRVNPGDPDSSYLVQKLEGTAPFGVRMPFGGPFLDQALINTLRAWIAAGALP